MGSLPQYSMDCLVQSASGQGQTAVRSRPEVKAPHDVLVRVSAVALNPTDFKSPASNPSPGAIMGCDFIGSVVSAGEVADKDFPSATRVCGFVHGSNPGNPEKGSFAEYLVTDSRLLIRVPDSWTDLEGAALGGVGWGTVALAMEVSLQLPGRPSKPVAPRDDGSRTPVLVYGGGTATGTMACQILSMYVYPSANFISILRRQWLLLIHLQFRLPAHCHSVQHQLDSGAGVWRRRSRTVLVAHLWRNYSRPPRWWELAKRPGLHQLSRVCGMLLHCPGSHWRALRRP